MDRIKVPSKVTFESFYTILSWLSCRDEGEFPCVITFSLFHSYLIPNNFNSLNQIKRKNGTRHIRKATPDYQ